MLTWEGRAFVVYAELEHPEASAQSVSELAVQTRGRQASKIEDKSLYSGLTLPFVR